MSLTHALILSRYFFATDERDKIYALLGLARDGMDLVPNPTYMHSVSEVFEQLTKGIMGSQRPNNVIMLADRSPLFRRFLQVPA